ncbi:ABC transporter substrate-binding protein [Kiloniella laminariae]|uniref:ABC transporter substrate-binding protein n=1 Tax=Kiloniella laminariae TaxID=454162 RepID=A0ABT4LNF4_9PROT|nr:ABC transporter substrate-binding protein [Kiloniella laminariae]MCZ4282591.1 ABC transporter substrate-binding protein [Kiloniella laminariae]
MSEIEYYKSLVATGKMTRRDFMAKSSALGLSIAAATTLLSSSANATPIKGGHLKVGMAGGQTTDSLDPATITQYMPQVMTFASRNCLVEVNVKGEATPELAEGWEAKPGAQEWVFNLRKGVEFHNGKTMDADDVVWSIQHHLGEKSESGAKGILGGVAEIKADGKDKVIVSLTSGNADLPFLLSDYHLQIMPVGEDPASGIGTGGYQIESFEPGVRFLAKKNPNYFKSDRAHVDSVEILAIEDVAARTSALQTGEVHLINRVDPKTLSLLKRAKNVQILSTSGAQHYTMPMMGDRAPFDNNDLRLAMKYAIDREQLLNTVLRGYGRVGNDHPIAATDQYFAADLEQRTYDPDKAAFHFKKAGFEGQTIPLHTSDAAFAGAVDTAVLFKESASKAGITIDLVREPNDGYWSNVWMQKNFCFSYWGGRITPDLMFSTAFSSDAAWNEGFWKNEKFDKLLVEARAELDQTKRRALYTEMQTMVSNEGSVIIPMFADYLDAATKNIKGFEHVATYGMSGFRAPEQVWIDG